MVLWFEPPHGAECVIGGGALWFRRSSALNSIRRRKVLSCLYLGEGLLRDVIEFPVPSNRYFPHLGYFSICSARNSPGRRNPRCTNCRLSRRGSGTRGTAVLALSHLQETLTCLVTGSCLVAEDSPLLSLTEKKKTCLNLVWLGLESRLPYRGGLGRGLGRRAGGRS